MRMSEMSFVKMAKSLAIGLGMLVGTTGCFTNETPVAPPPGYRADAFGGSTGTNSAPVAVELQFKPGDTIKVEFSDTELTTIETEIKHDGTISLPLIEEPFKVAGKTSREAEAGIHKKYVPDLYRRLTVTVTPGARFFYVGGQVNRPDRLQYAGRTTVLKAIQTAGGLTNFADKKRIQVTRASGQIIIINWDKALKNPELDVEIFPGDQINVPESII